MTGKLAIVGGSGLFDLDGLELVAEHPLETLYGEPTAPVIEGKLEGRTVYFLSRHGKGRHIPPHAINYRANMKGLQCMGIDRVLTVNIVGGVTDGMAPGTWMVPDQIIDYTWGREHSFFDDESETTEHVDFGQPYDPALAAQVLAAARAAGVAVVDGGTYGCTQGPRLESAAEIQRLRRDGCDVVGMTAMPEAGLARELGLAYAGICLVVNWAAGIGGETISVEEMQGVVAGRMPLVAPVIGQLLGLLEAAAAD